MYINLWLSYAFGTTRRSLVHCWPRRTLCPFVIAKGAFGRSIRSKECLCISTLEDTQGWLSQAKRPKEE
ncbi:hypothetical protein AXX17_AT1G39470 [Arabidopsis thaliana]|uniref:Uncharacterized protein n=1 Tax=Arabidopsis thaliana TaxID=3702 RepID=A0A178WDY4_ARATH|nr:hypothetical protein AXX17_AT1G39470 [Arabidopsis thaliana]